MPHPPSSTPRRCRPVHTPMLRLPRPRFLLSSSREFVVSRRRLVSPRPAASFPSGTFRRHISASRAPIGKASMHHQLARGLACQHRRRREKSFFVADDNWKTVMVSPVFTVWPTSRLRSLSSMFSALYAPSGISASNGCTGSPLASRACA